MERVGIGIWGSISLGRASPARMLHENNRMRTISSSDCSWVRLVKERVQQQHAVDHAVGAIVAAAEPIREDEEKEDE